MTTDLVTYYGQTPIIDQLVDKYGVYLEKLLEFRLKNGKQPSAAELIRNSLKV